MDNILINFTADPAGLQPGIEGLEQLRDSDEALYQSILKTTAADVARGKSMSESAKASKKDVEGLTTSFTNLGKSAIGGTFAKTLADLQKNLKGTTDEFKQLSLVLDVAKQKLATLDLGSDEFKDLAAQIVAGQVVLEQYGKTTDDTTTKTKSLKAELKAMKEEIARRQISGESSTDLDVLIARAGELDDALKDVSKQIANTGSDTRSIDGFVQALGTATQAIAGVQAAQALLGDEDKDFQNALIKLNALMVLSNSIQSVQSALLKDSAVVVAISNVQRKAQLVVTQLQTAAESESIIVRYAAIAAQKVLNAVMAANPVGIVLTALTALVSIVLIFTSRVTDAAKAQATLNGALNEAGKGLDAELAGIEASNARILASMKDRGASDTDLAKQEVANANVRNQARQESLTALQKVYNSTTALDEESVKLKQEVGEKIIKIEEAITKDYDEAVAQRGEAERQSYLASLKSATAFSEARVALAKKNSQEELDAQIAAIRAAADEQLKSNPNITSGESANIQAQAEKQIFDLKFANQKFLLESAKAGIDAEVLKAKEGSREEFDFKLQQLKAQRDIDLQTQGLTNNQKLAIDATYEKARLDLAKATTQKIAEDQVNSRISETSDQLSILQLNGVKETDDKVLQLKKDLIDEQSALEVIGIANSEKNEELRRLKIKAVYDKALVDKQTLEKAKVQAEIQEDSGYSQRKYNLAIQQDQILLESGKATAEQRANATKDMADKQDLIYKSQLDEVQRLYDNQIISYEEYSAKLDELQDKSNQRTLDKEKILAEKKEILRQRSLDIAKDLGDGILDINLKNIQTEQDRNQQLYDSKLITQTEFNNKKAALDKQAAKIAQEKAIFDIGIDLAKGLFQLEVQKAAYASNVLTLPLAANVQLQELLLIGEAAVQTGLILAKGYKTGGLVTGAGSGTSDSVPAWLSSGEFVAKADMTAKHRDALEAINKDQFHEYIMMNEMPKRWQYDIPMIPPGMEDKSRMLNGHPIDYDKLGDVLAQKLSKELANNPHLNIQLDQDGFNLSVKKGLDTIAYKNKRLTA